jgi:Tat protein translocase TatB subunit
MDFFGIGPLEFLLILIILIVVVGPEKIPDLARRMGRAMRAFRGATTQLTQEIEGEISAVKKDVDIRPKLADAFRLEDNPNASAKSTKDKQDGQ